jgi:hypothetical protein
LDLIQRKYKKRTGRAIKNNRSKKRELMKLKIEIGYGRQERKNEMKEDVKKGR